MPPFPPGFALPAAMLASLLIGAPPARAATPAPRVLTLRPAGSPAPAITTPALVTMLLRQGEAAGRDARHKPAGTLNYPTAITVDAQSNIYITNMHAGVNVYNSKFQKTAEITSNVSDPTGVAVNFEGNIYVANYLTNTVTIYKPPFEQIGTITDSTLRGPISLYVDSDDTTWVLDIYGILHAYLSDGTVLSSSQTGGSVVGPWGPNVTVWGIPDPQSGYDESYEDRAVSLHDGGCCVNFLSGSPYAGGEAQDQSGQQYVSDNKNDAIDIFSTDGLSQVGTIPLPGSPIGVAVDNRLSRLYVALPVSDEVYVYSIKPPYKLLHIIH